MPTRNRRGDRSQFGSELKIVVYGGFLKLARVEVQACHTHGERRQDNQTGGAEWSLRFFSHVRSLLSVKTNVARCEGRSSVGMAAAPGNVKVIFSWKAVPIWLNGAAS